MAKTKFISKDGVEIRRSGRNYVPPEESPTVQRSTPRTPPSRKSLRLTTTEGQAAEGGSSMAEAKKTTKAVTRKGGDSVVTPVASPKTRKVTGKGSGVVSPRCSTRLVKGGGQTKATPPPNKSNKRQRGCSGASSVSSPQRPRTRGNSAAILSSPPNRSNKGKRKSAPIDLDPPSDRDEEYVHNERDQEDIEEMGRALVTYEEEPEIQTPNPDHPSDTDEEGRVGDDSDEEDGNGHETIVEETCKEMGDIFGEEARKDDCEVDEDTGDEYAWDEERVPDPPSSDEDNEEEMRSAQAYREDIDPEELLQLGKTFSDADEFKHACLRYTLKTRRNIKYYRSSALKIGAMCAAEMREDEAPCPWKIYCSYEKRRQRLQVKTYVNIHKCEVNGESKLLKRSAIADLFAERLRLNPKMKAKEIQAEILREYQMEAKENSCIKAKTKIMNERRKTHEQHFDRIWDYQAEVFRSNPGSTFEIETIPGAAIRSKQRFYRLYVCFQAQKESWKKTCRPVIGLDGAFLKWDIKGQLLAAVGRDGDNRIVPIAWAMVEIENDTNWDWFVRLLAIDLELGDGKGYVLVSDKQKGLVKGIHIVLPEAEHRQCCRHIYENWKKSGKDLRLQRLFWYIAKSYTPGLFKHNMETLKEYDSGAWRSLQVTKPETWSRAFFKIGSQCNDCLNNLSESFNKTIKEPRKKPLLDLLEAIRIHCMTRNFNRSKLANKRQTRFTKKTHQELDRVEKKSTECSLRWAIGPETEVEYKGHSYVVNIEEQTCACRSWQLNGIPCIHAAKVILRLGRKLSEFVADCYTTERWRQTYSYGIRPLNGIMEWPQTNRFGVVPPPNRAGNPGRPRNHDRKKGKNESSSSTKLSRANRVMTCSNCKQEGHNKARCSNAFVESAAKKPRGRPKKTQEHHFEFTHYSQTPNSFTQSSGWQGAYSQGQSSQGNSSNAQTSRWEHSSTDQASQAQTSNAIGWARWFN